MTAQQALTLAARDLAGAGVETPMGDARRLLAFVLEIPADRLTLHLHDPLITAAHTAFQAAIARRASREPLSHITGKRLFWNRSFTVTPDVLDPRPETETLIAAALELPFSRVLDLGTGSGCILTTLLGERAGVLGVGSDVSQSALTVARANAQAHAVAERASFIKADWFTGVTGQFDLIVSNPPYIAQAELAGLAPEVRDHEPLGALSDGADGLTAYRAICAGAGAHLAPCGYLMVEIGPSQATAVTVLMASAGLSQIAVLRDMDGRDRVISAQRPG